MLVLHALRPEASADQNECENRNENGGACARGAKCPHVGVLTRFVSVFVFVFIFAFSNFDFRNDYF